MDIWGNCKKNLVFLRERYRLSEEQIADGAKITVSDYRLAETVSPSSIFPNLVTFWYENYLISPNDLLLFKSNESYIKIKEDRFTKELERFINT